jgi:hypothetical protein
MIEFLSPTVFVPAALPAQLCIAQIDVIRLNPQNSSKAFLIVSKLGAPNLIPEACPASEGYPKSVCVQRLSQNGRPLEKPDETRIDSRFFRRKRQRRY